MSSDTLIFVGLGNPGKQYDMTRHNIGFMVLEHLAKELGVEFKSERRFLGRFAKCASGEARLALLLPETYMNASGEAVQRVLHYNKWGADQVIVVCDDTAIPFGELRLRVQGTDGGHNGLKSVAAHLGTKHYIRLRMGVGAPPHPGQDLADYVLASFTSKEKEDLEKFIRHGADVLLKLTKQDPLHVMNEVNKRSKNESTNRKPL